MLGGEPTDIALSGGTIVAIGADARNAVRDPRVIDAEGLIALPGLVDIHTHLRQPGGEDAETVFTGTRAARSAATRPSTRWPTRRPRRTRPPSSTRSCA